MKVVVTAAEMREIDRRTIEEVGVPSLLLMENAGLGVVNVADDMLVRMAGERVLVFCGKGNNGGDGMVVARHLFNRGYGIRIYLVGDAGDLKGDALANREILEGFGLDLHPIREKKDLRRIVDGDLIIDALLGTGITGELRGIVADVIGWMNRSLLPIVSVDLPSGLNSDDGSYKGTCVKAEATATMAALKRGLVLPPGRDLAGEVSIVDIGSPDFMTDALNLQTHLLEASDIASRLPARPEGAHKGDFGKVVVLAGSPGMTGAAVLASLASLRVGAGLTILGVPRSLNDILETKVTEVMTKPLHETEDGTLSRDAEVGIDELVAWADVLAVGPGIGSHEETTELVRRMIRKIRKPVVIDADGLNAFSGRPELLEKGRGRQILTPHYGELSRIVGRSIEDIEQNRIEVARTYSKRFESVLVLKGSPTIVAGPDGNVFVNPTGNSGMATAGSGDVLTGMIVGLLAQGCSSVDAALCGVFLHGLAGDLIAEASGSRALIAGDLIDGIIGAFAVLEAEG